MTAPTLTKTRDPFEPAKIEVAQTKPVEPSKPKLPAITPAAAGLVLTSTIIGPQRRVAQISGKTYAVGQTIAVLKEKKEKEAWRTHVQADRSSTPPGRVGGGWSTV